MSKWITQKHRMKYQQSNGEDISIKACDIPQTISRTIFFNAVYFLFSNWMVQSKVCISSILFRSTAAKKKNVMECYVGLECLLSIIEYIKLIYWGW